MKNSLLLALVLFSPAALAMENTLVGSYEFRHDVAFGGGYTEKGCRKEGGRWEGGACYLPAADLVTLAPGESAEEWNVKVDTIRTNGRTCEFVGTAKAVSGHEFIASAPTEEARMGEREDEFVFVPTVCELKISYTDENTLQVKKVDARKCQMICATRSGLEVPEAKRMR